MHVSEVTAVWSLDSSKDSGEPRMGYIPTHLAGDNLARTIIIAGNTSGNP